MSGVQIENKRIAKAIVIRPSEEAIQKAQSNIESTEDTFSTFFKDSKRKIIQPPYDPNILMMLPECSSELVQIIEAMEINIEGYGQRIVVGKMDDQFLTDNKDEILDEEDDLKSLIDLVNADDNMTSLRRKTRKDIEILGYGFWEVLTTNSETLGGFNYMEARNVRLCTKDEEFTEVKKKYTTSRFKIKEKTFYKKFRRYVQIVGNKVIYFKEWDDPRVIDKYTGDVIVNPTKVDLKDKAATGILYFKIHCSRTPYGLPRYIGNLFSIYGSRASDQINFQTFKNNNVPSMVISISNGMLTQGSVDRLQEYVNSQIKGSDNYSKFLVLEAETQDEEAQNPGAMKIDIKPMTESQRDDQLFQKYDANNADKLRRSYRLPGIYVGKTDGINRATADAMRRLADEQVFSPERNEMDRKINSVAIHYNTKYHTIKSNSPNVTDDGALTKILAGAERTGALTPNISRRIISEIVNEELPQLQETDDFNPNIPFSLTMAEAVKKLDGAAPVPGNIGTVDAGAEPVVGDDGEEAEDANIEMMFSKIYGKIDEIYDGIDTSNDTDVGLDFFGKN